MFSAAHNQQLSLATEAAQRRLNTPTSYSSIIYRLLDIHSLLIIFKLNLLLVCGGRLSSAPKIQLSY